MNSKRTKVLNVSFVHLTAEERVCTVKMINGTFVLCWKKNVTVAAYFSLDDLIDMASSQFMFTAPCWVTGENR